MSISNGLFSKRDRHKAKARADEHCTVVVAVARGLVFVAVEQVDRHLIVHCDINELDVTRVVLGCDDLLVDLTFEERRAGDGDLFYAWRDRERKATARFIAFLELLDHLGLVGILHSQESAFDVNHISLVELLQMISLLRIRALGDGEPLPIPVRCEHAWAVMGVCAYEECEGLQAEAVEVGRWIGGALGHGGWCDCKEWAYVHVFDQLQNKL